MRLNSGNTEILIWQGDITVLDADAIVNAANKSLLGGGGVDGAIHRAAGPQLLEACIPLKGCNTGEAKITPGFRLPASYVIHTVGPVYRDGKHNEAALLASCYTSSLQLALDRGIKSIAFPAISTGVYGYPPEEAAAIAWKTVKEFTNKNGAPEKVIFVVYGDKAKSAYEAVSEKQ